MVVGYKTFILAAWKSVFCQEPADEDVELSAPPAPCLPGCCHTPVYWLVLCQLDTAGVITEKGASVEEMPP